MTRPWAVRAKAQYWRTKQWGKWHTHGTYTTHARASAAADNLRRGWLAQGADCEVNVVLSKRAKAPLCGDAPKSESTPDLLP